MLSFFRCVKCSWQSYCPTEVAKEKMVCGAVVEYIPADDPTVGNEGPLKSMGLKPLGCGGSMKEITREEAFEDVR